MLTQEKLTAAAVVLPPLHLASGQGEINLEVSGTAILFAIPAWMAGKYCDFTAVGASVDVLEGDDTVDVVYDQETAITNGELVLDVNTGRRIVDGATKSWRVSVPSEATHMSVEASGAGRLCISVSSEPIRR